LYRLARRLSWSADDAHDLVQETFLRAARAANAIPIGFSKEEAWLVRVLVNLRRDEWRKIAVRKRLDSEIDLGNAVETGLEGAVIAREIVWRALDSLPPRRRAVLVMHELEGLTVSAVASLLGVSAVTVRWHLSMGRRELSRALSPHIGASR
jgi:RNA polymerase sigma-70 factor (ECF subfamily)